jgi:hypothetical protein
LFEATLRIVRSTVKSSISVPTSGGTPANSTHTCFPPTHPYTRTFACRSVDLSSCGLVKKFTSASFFIETSACLKISKSTSLTSSCFYLKHGSFIQWVACSPKVTKYALR